MRTLIAVLLLSFNLYAGPTKVGNGNEGFDLEGWDLVEKGILIKTRDQAVAHVKRLNTNGIRGLGSLIPELENSKIYLTKRNISSKKLEELGAFHSGMEGFVFARTFPRAYAATRFFPAALKLSESQLMALHIHEALHRALPKEFRENEKIVTKMTLALISPETSHDNVLAMAKESMPKLFMTAEEIRVHESSKLQNPGHVSVSFNKYSSSTKRDNQPGVNLPMEHSYDVDAQFYPFGGKTYAAGFGIKSGYIFTERDENYFGPLELTGRMLLWSPRSYDFEFIIGTTLMSASNSKVVDTVYGQDSILAGIEAKKVRDDYRLMAGIEFRSGDEYQRTLSGTASKYEVGSLITLYGEAYYPWKKFEFGAHFKLYSLDSIRVTSGTAELLNKDRDQYFMAGPIFNYRYNKKFGVTLRGDYLFNSNTNQSEDNIRDLFGNSLGQWKFTLMATMFFY